MLVLAFYNIKGGVGKTSTAVNLAYLTASQGISTLLFDLDPQGSASFYFRIKPRIKGKLKKFITSRNRVAASIKGSDFEKLDILPADFTYRKLDILFHGEKKSKKQLKKLIKPLLQYYDYILLDCPPNITLLSENIFSAADYIIVPTIPTPLSMRTYKQIKKYLAKQKFNPATLLPFFSMVEKRKKLHKEIILNSGTEFPEFLSSSVPYSSIIEKMGVQRTPVGAFAPGSAAAKAYNNLANEILQRVGVDKL